MVNKRGAISMEMIIIIILALITLVVVAAAFTGGMSKLMEKISTFVGGIPTTELPKATCKNFCDSNSSSYCTQTFEGEVAGKKCPELYPECPSANRAKLGC